MTLSVTDAVRQWVTGMMDGDEPINVYALVKHVKSLFKEKKQWPGRVKYSTVYGILHVAAKNEYGKAPGKCSVTQMKAALDNKKAVILKMPVVEVDQMDIIDLVRETKRLIQRLGKDKVLQILTFLATYDGVSSGSLEAAYSFMMEIGGKPAKKFFEEFEVLMTA